MKTWLAHRVAIVIGQCRRQGHLGDLGQKPVDVDLDGQGHRQDHVQGHHLHGYRESISRGIGHGPDQVVVRVRLGVGHGHAENMEDIDPGIEVGHGQGHQGMTTGCPSLRIRQMWFRFHGGPTLWMNYPLLLIMHHPGI